jgi:hypothetical protein
VYPAQTISYCAAFVSLATVFPRTAAAQSPTTPADISRQIADRFAAASSLHVKWTMTTDIVAKIDDMYAAYYSIFPVDEYAVKGQKRFRRTEAALNLATAPNSRKVCTYYFDGEITRSQCRNCDPPPGMLEAENYHVVRGDDAGPVGEREQAMVYMEAVGSPFYDGKYLDLWRRIRGRTRRSVSQFEVPYPFSLVPALQSDQYSVGLSDVEINGIRCVLLERAGLDKLWLAPDLGYAVVQREWNWGHGEPLMMRYVNSDFKQVVDGIWLPMTAQRQAFADPARYSNSVGALHFINTCKVVEMHGNDVPDELFTIRPIPGSTAIDNTKTTAFGRPVYISYVIGDTPEQTQENLERRVAERRKLSLAALKFWEWSAGDWFAFGNLLLIGSLIVYARNTRKHLSMEQTPRAPRISLGQPRGAHL